MLRFLRITLSTLVLQTTVFCLTILGEPASIALISPLTGKFQEQGAECNLGYQFAIDEAPVALTQSLNFVYEDDQSSPKMASSIAQRLLADKNLIALSVFSSSTALAINPISVRTQTPLLALSSHPDVRKNNPYSFPHWIDANQEAEFFYENIRDENKTKIAIVTTENDYTLIVRSIYLELAAKTEKSHLAVLNDELINDGIDPRSLVLKILQNNPEIIFLNVLGPDFPNLLKFLHQNRYTGKIYSVASNARKNYLEAAGIDASQGTIFLGPDYRQPDFVRHLKNQTSSAEWTYAFCCYLGLKRALKAFEKLDAKEKTNRNQFFEELKKIKEIPIGKNQVIPSPDRGVKFDYVKLLANQGQIEYFKE